MYIKQFQFFDINNEEQEIIPDFCEWLYLQIYKELDTKTNRKKIQARLKYIQQARWMNWKKSYNITVQEILDLIYNSLKYQKNKINRWIIYTDSNITVPNSYTSIDRLIRFINYGDINFTGTGMFTYFENYFSNARMNNLWHMYVNYRLGYIPQSIIQC